MAEKQNGIQKPDPEKVKKANQALGCGCLIVIVALVAAGWAVWNWLSTPADANAPDPAQYTASAESMQQLFKDCADFTYDDLSVDMLENEGKGVCAVSFVYTQSSWDTTAFVNSTIVDFVDFQELAYQVQGIDGVRFVVSTEMVDERGNTSIKKVEQFLMYKDVFALYDWENTQGSIFDQFESDCAEFYIHPGILQDTDTEDVIYY